MPFINLDAGNIESEHICCAFSDKKCTAGYELKKSWLKNEFNNELAFLRLDERAKVFIEFGPSETAWLPISAPNCIALGCFWVSGRYAGQGYGNGLLEHVINTVKNKNKSAIVAVVGFKKFHFMSDTKWLLKHGFEVVDTTETGFSLLQLRLGDAIQQQPRFNDIARSGQCHHKTDITVYYSNRCPYTEHHVTTSLIEATRKRGLSLTTIKLETVNQAQSSPTPATIFSLFRNGQFVTTDLSVCLDSRFDKIVKST
ncbi:GNAT family N-acetyltransferase [Acidovorax sp. Q11]